MASAGDVEGARRVARDAVVVFGDTVSVAWERPLPAFAPRVSVIGRGLPAVDGAEAIEADSFNEGAARATGDVLVFWSPETAEHDPDYRELGRFPSREKALEFLSADG